MVFSSNIFLFAFLPAFLIAYYLMDARLRNLFLFASSLAFYFWGAGSIVLFVVAALGINYQLGRFVAGRRWLLIMGVAINLLYLFYFKYYGFFYTELARCAAHLGWQLGPAPSVLLPLGISFCVFQAISYLADCYWGKHPPAPCFLDFGMYLTAFPHVIAGPIVRYDHIRAEIPCRPLNVDKLFQGIWRFSLGLGKKVLLANNLGAVADHIFTTPLGELRFGTAWLGALCYTFQIYYDFSGYSDMAIGLGRMLGFTFPENFDQPYRAQTVTEFWRRWHMTLSTWFRDYVYVPLGGNRAGPLRTYANLAIVFILCGLWHGAAWTFVLWGFYHGLLLIIERVLRDRFGFQARGPLAAAACFVLVMFGWVFFRLDSFATAVAYCSVMLGLGPTSQFQFFALAYYLQPATLTYLVFAFIFALMPFERLASVSLERRWLPSLQAAGSLALMLLSCLALSVGGFNPFIYFRF